MKKANPFRQIFLKTTFQPARRRQRVREQTSFTLPGTNSRLGIRDLALIRLYQDCHLEIHQIQELNISDIDLEMGAITVKSRTGKIETRFFNEETAKTLARWLNARRLFAAETPAVFTSLHWTAGRKKPGQRLSKRGIRMILDKYLKPDSNKKGELYENR